MKNLLKNKSISYLFTLLLGVIILGCGKEEFGTTPRKNSSSAEPVQVFEQSFCAQPTEIAPKVDILYIVDNSTSTYYLADDIKNGINSMVNSVSLEFDYRIIGTGILPIDDTPYNDYQVLTNSSDSLSSEASSRKIISSSELTFFTSRPTSTSTEAGLSRAINFINNNTGLFREGANLVVIIFSNGRDAEVESKPAWEGGSPIFNQSIYNERLSSFNSLKTSLNLKQLRLISTTAHSDCKSGWFSSLQSYVKMSKELYSLSGSTDSPIYQDSYDLCAGVSNVFSPINSSIKVVIKQNTYRYWPLTFAKDENVRNDFGDIIVTKINDGSSSVLPSTAWTYYEHTGSDVLNLREPASSGGEYSGKHFIRFTDGNLITSPECIQIKSSTRTEYFGYVELSQEPKPETITLKINGEAIPKSEENGWSYVGNLMDQNIKMPYPKEGDELPAIKKSGFMLKINGEKYYYKSGDSIEVNFIPAPI